MSDTFPPPGFIPAESAVSGIVVYKPQPEDADQQEIVNFRCPNCDSATAYSTDDGGLTCTYCGYHEAPQVEVVGRRAAEFEFTVETMQRAMHGWGQARKELVCQGCAAHTTLSEEMLTHTCPFCGSNKVVQMKAAQDALRPRFLVPFTVTTDECRRTMAGWLGDSWMLPRGLQRLGRSTEFTPIYIPFWTFDSRAQATWRAEVAKRRRRGNKTETVWRWENGRVNLFYDDVPVAGTGKLSRLLLEQVDAYDLQALVPYKPEFLAGLRAQAYDVTLEDAWTQARQRMRLHTKKQCQNQASSQRMRNFSMNLDFSEESWRYILLPLYLAVYRYGHDSYQVLINGQTGAIAGQRPVDWRRVALAIVAMLLPGLLLGTAAAVITAVDPASNVSTLLLAGAILFVIGLIAAVVTLLRARELRAQDG